ncbi:MAG: DUF1517 domain-containing protein [Polyangiales bacterium]
MRTLRRWVLVALTASLFLLPFLALAQNTGGSFGGSRWGSGSSRSSSSSSRSGSWGGGSSSSRTTWSTGSGGSYGGGSYGGTSYGSRSGGDSGGGVCCILTVFALIVLFAVIMNSRNKNRPFTPNYMPMQPMGPMGPMGYQDTFSLGALAIAFDSSVRANVQAEIDQIARQVDMSSDAGLAAAASMLSQMLSRYLDHALLTHHALAENLSMQQAQQMFQQAVDTERGRFMVETVRKDGGGLRTVQGPNQRARAEEGGGFVVVTLLVSRRGPMPGFVPAVSRPALAADLQVLLAGSGAMQAMEVVWVPSDPNDVMSSAEMAVVFPTLKPIAPDARVGRRACGSCKTVYAAELPQCPNCGAPST